MVFLEASSTLEGDHPQVLHLQIHLLGVDAADGLLSLVLLVPLLEGLSM